MERDVASEKGGEQAAWRDLVARLESPVSYDQDSAPWPDREDLPGTDTPPATTTPAATTTPPATKTPPATSAHGDDDSNDFDALDEDADEFFVPPQAQPAAADAVTRTAWVALFGGPGYLFVASLLGWQLSGWTELAAIGAFVTGFLVLVFRLGDGPSRRDGPDQGAVV